MVLRTPALDGRILFLSINARSKTNMELKGDKGAKGMSKVVNVNRMSVNRALSELKRLDQRINKTIKNGMYVGAKKGSSKKVKTVYTVKEYSARCKSDYDSVISLIDRRNKIKQAVVLSNACTYVEIKGVPYTVAEAIERKTTINFEKRLLEQMKKEYRSWQHEIDTQNERMQNNLEKIMDTLAGGDKKGVESNELVLKYREDNEWSLVDPLKIEEKITQLEEMVEGFESEVDFVLTESNAVTFIEVAD